MRGSETVVCWEKKREMTELEMEILEINRGKTDRMHGKKQSEETCKRRYSYRVTERVTNETKCSE